MAQDTPHPKNKANTDPYTQLTKAELQERLALLVLRRSQLTADEAALLRVYFPTIYRAHRKLVKDCLRKRGLESHDIDELHQETFLTLHRYILEHGFPDNISAMLTKIAERKLKDHARRKKHAPPFTGVRSSTSEKPRSFDAELALDRRTITREILEKLPQEQQDAFELVLVNGLTHVDAAAVLGIPEGTLKSRLLAAKRAFAAHLEALPPSQRELV